MVPGSVHLLRALTINFLPSDQDKDAEASTLSTNALTSICLFKLPKREHVYDGSRTLSYGDAGSTRTALVRVSARLCAEDETRVEVA